VRPRRHIRRYAAPYLVRMIKPNLIVSHDWHVQPFCQRSLRFIRLSGAVWIEAQAVKPGCPRTCCARRCGLPGQHPAFLREPSKTTKLPCWRQAQSVPLLRPLQQVVGGKFLSSRRSSGRKGDVPFKAGERSIQNRETFHLQQENAPFKGVAQRKISKSDQQNAPEPPGLAGVELLGHAMDCSLRDSLQGFRGYSLT
jgi:hypothetical protein